MTELEPEDRARLRGKIARCLAYAAENAIFPTNDEVADDIIEALDITLLGFSPGVCYVGALA